MASSFFGGQISEVTPEFMDVDIITGLPNKVWSGFIEQHITADVAFGVWQYYTITGDQDYMDRYGYELIFDTARFWVSRLEDKDRLISEDVDPEGRTVFSETDTVGGISRDYNLKQINQIQVSKQADVLVLFFLLEDLFPAEVKRATWEYYSARTLHDSSLSLCTHAVLAADMKEKDLAYDMFEKSIMIDLGPVMTTSDAGIHAASFGGIWQGVVYGFGGLRMLGGKLRIDPILPDAWEGLSYTLWWKGQKLEVDITHDSVIVTNLTGTDPVEILLAGKTVIFKDKATRQL